MIKKAFVNAKLEGGHMKLIERICDEALRLHVMLQTVAKSERGGAGPYVLGWFLGVPGSILVIIYLIKHH